jgi:Flp pilus assembly protein TadB
MMEQWQVELSLKQAEQTSRLEERVTAIEDARDQERQDARADRTQELEDAREGKRQKPATVMIVLWSLTVVLTAVATVVSLLAYFKPH